MIKAILDQICDTEEFTQALGVVVSDMTIFAPMMHGVEKH
jgi:hypothetical protein